MLIPGQIISIATFPGVIMHELSHVICCRIFNVEVKEVCYFKLGNPSGYVLHEPTKNWIHTVAIATGPFFFNSLICLLISFPIVTNKDIDEITFSSSILLWLAISIGMHAIPSRGDAKSMWQEVSGKRGSIFAKLFVAPIVAVIYLLSLGSIIWLDLIYGVILSTVVPLKLFELIFNVQ